VIQAETSREKFATWRAGFRKKALRRGISAHLFERLFDGMLPNPEVLAKDNTQPEFVQPIWEYLDRAVSQTRVETGRQMLKRHQVLLGKIEQVYQTQPEIIVVSWGFESSYGTHLGQFPVLQSLASLASGGRRCGLFEAQLIAALQLVQSGRIGVTEMTGSWAGAMGHTQFMPSSVLRYGVDFDGDGRCDIRGDDPTDALASTAAYLAGSGWQQRQRWGQEVSLKPGFDFDLSCPGMAKPPMSWAQLGVVMADAKDPAPTRVWAPVGLSGPAFMVTGNFDVLLRYNAAPAYALAVGHLADRLGGAAKFSADWPRDQPAMSFAEQREFQQRLTAAGYDTGPADGIFGPDTFGALRSYQQAMGLIGDGYPRHEILVRLRR